ncbi:hypothetical protein GCM10027188_07810 [Lysobacter humi (ex Lee et al. 2017)]
MDRDAHALRTASRRPARHLHASIADAAPGASCASDIGNATCAPGLPGRGRYNRPMPALVVHCTCPDAQVADRIATALVDARLAACVQQLPALRSTYRWEGRVEQAQEVLLLIKTATDRLDAVIASVRALHPYELPELLAVEACGGLPEYLDWVVAQSRADA